MFKPSKRDLADDTPSGASRHNWMTEVFVSSLKG